MKVSKTKLYIMLARKRMSLNDLRNHFSPNTICRITNGSTVRIRTVSKLAELLECDPADIVEMED